MKKRDRAAPAIKPERKREDMLDNGLMIGTIHIDWGPTTFQTVIAMPSKVTIIPIQIVLAL